MKGKGRKNNFEQSNVLSKCLQQFGLRRIVGNRDARYVLDDSTIMQMSEENFRKHVVAITINQSARRGLLARKTCGANEKEKLNLTECEDCL